ncbi:restriction endonuclease [Streptomyces sp. NPDC004286]|uniref:restriction endonuclease n=1 Tax=Streptomyces sp. NPDC004286 TaxID=3364696 RepID=UPI00367E57B5
MIDESVLLESRTLRTSVLDRTEVLDRVKTLSLLPDGLHVTTAMVATYFGVTVEAVRQLTRRHREELAANGMVVLRGADLRTFESDNVSLSLGSYPQARRSLTVYSRRAVLNIAMLLRDSEVARQVRAYLLDVEQASRARLDGPALDDRIDQRIAHVLGRTVVPMFNALIETSGGHQRELVALRDGVRRIEQRLQLHHARLRRLEGRRG